MTNRQAENCLRRFREGDESAFEELYSELCVEVRLFSYAILKDYALSEDVMQEVFIKLYKDSLAFRGASAYKTYIFSVTRNISLNVLRKRQTEIALELLPEQPDDGKTESTVLNRLQIDRLLQYVDSDQKQIILLRSMGFKHREIANILEIPLGTVSWKYSDAVKKLKEVPVE